MFLLKLNAFIFVKESYTSLYSCSERGLEDSYGSSINSMNELFTAGSSSSDSKLCKSILDSVHAI